ncbi:MAG: hypothetical protein IJ641_10605 [Lachnospiraceae bacterium]|nr:hypothetical protein [Lachnospiraceae bacterium]
MKNRLGDIGILVAIIAVIGVLIFMKKDSIKDALHIGSGETAEESEETMEDSEDTEEEDEGTEEEPEDEDTEETVEADASADTSGEEDAPDVGDGISVQNNIKVSDPLLASTHVNEPEGTAVVPEAGLIENNIIGASWTEIKDNYSYTDFEAEPEDIAQLRFLDDGNLKYYQSPASGEIFGVQDDTIVAYLKRWDGTPLNEAISVEGLFDVAPYIYQCTDYLNMYEWKIANCYVGLLVEDTGDGVAANAPLYAESYVLQRRINTFYK